MGGLGSFKKLQLKNLMLHFNKYTDFKMLKNSYLKLLTF